MDDSADDLCSVPNCSNKWAVPSTISNSEYVDADEAYWLDSDFDFEIEFEASFNSGPYLNTLLFCEDCAKEYLGH